MRRVLHGLLIVLFFLVYVSPSWPGSVYQWTDEEGNVNFTDDLSNIPEKYREGALLRSELPPLRSKQGVSPPSGAEPFPTESPWLDDAGHDRQFWQDKIKGLRKKKEALAKKREKIQQEANALSNPLINSRIEQRERFQLLQNEIEKLNQEIKEVDRQIEVVVPEEARRLNAPPGWLRVD